MLLRELLKDHTDVLQRAGIEDARFDARQLMFHAFCLDAGGYLLREREPLESLCPDPEKREAALSWFREAVSRRASRVPLQQILGSVGFFGLDFYVNEDVLCPRADTETLVDWVLSDYRTQDPGTTRLLDLCTGSGCIGIALKKCGGFSDVTLVDISEKALRVARRNAAAILDSGLDKKMESEPGLRILQSDLFAGVDGEHFDLIVSNPPYIPTAVVETLEPEVRDHEPHIALDGREDGLYFYRRITAEAREHLRTGGRLYVEIGYDQGESVCALFREAGFRDVSLRQDLGGNDRVVRGTIGERIEDV